MLRFDANVTTMYGGASILDALRRAGKDGFSAVECRAPFGAPKDVVADTLDELGLEMVQFNTPMGDYGAGDRGIACIPGREEEFRQSIDLTLEYATALGCSQINCPAGLAAEGRDRVHLERLLAENLRYAARKLADAGIKLQLEPVNRRDTPGVLIWTLEQAERVIDMVDDENLYLQFDFYHTQVTQGDLARNFERLLPRINHVQVADNPGRHEPGTGEIDYGFIFSMLERLGYSGWVGCEYVPSDAGLDWMSTLIPGR